MIDKDFWKGKNVFVTGHTGFKGGWLSLWLSELGANVSGFSLSPHTNPNLFTIAKIFDRTKNFFGDITDYHRIKETLLKKKPEIVFHLAAQALVRYSYLHPIETYQTNVIGTANILEAIRYCPSVQAAVIVTSDKCYENKEWDWGYREFEPMGGFDPYSSSKGAAELIIAGYRRSFFQSNSSGINTHASIASARAGNVIGGGDWSEDRLIPDFFRAVKSGEEMLVRFPNAIRPWQHVLEPLRGYLLLAQDLFNQKQWAIDAWNFGPKEDDARSVRWILDKLCSRNEWKVSLKNLDIIDLPHEAHYLKLDISKTRNRLGWEPVLQLEKALDWVSDWYQLWISGKDPQKITIQQIYDYTDIMKSYHRERNLFVQ